MVLPLTVEAKSLADLKVEEAAIDGERRLGQIDQAVEEAGKREKTTTALSAMEAQRKACVDLAGERNEAAGTLWQS